MISAALRHRLLAAFLGLAVASRIETETIASDSRPAAGKDPVLGAMLEEMERSKGKLKLTDVPAPYYIDYRVVDSDQFLAEAAFGALRNATRQHMRVLRVVVRIGDYKQDSYYGPGEGVQEVGPVDDDGRVLRHALWLATDRAYKAAAEALTAKQGELKQYKVDQPVDDFARASPVESLGALAHLDFQPEPWLKTLEDASALYRNDPQIEFLDASLRFAATNRYFVSSEGTVVRSGSSIYQVYAGAHTQAADGMRLDRNHSDEASDPKQLPPREQILSRTAELVETLKQLRDAPVAEEEYRGPVLFSGDAAASVVAGLVGPNVLGNSPKLGDSARTSGAWATNYKSRVLPEFLSAIDDPTLASYHGSTLLGHYEVDDEGVPAMRVPVIENGQLVNYLVGREPIRDFPRSNGHGRAGPGPGGAPAPNLGNLILESSEPLSLEELKHKLLVLCTQRDLPYGYYVETLGPRLAPRLLYRVFAKDGHTELVRGAVFGDLDARSLRSEIMAAGKEATVENQIDPVVDSVASPALLFEELEVKRANTGNERLPDYPPPPVTDRQ
jgi:TldD protein